MIDRSHPLPITRQAEALGMARSTAYSKNAASASAGTAKALGVTMSSLNDCGDQ